MERSSVAGGSRRDGRVRGIDGIRRLNDINV